MEHLVQFTFSVDDDAIQRKLEESGYDDVVKKLYNNVVASLPKRGYYRDNVDWRQVAENSVKEFYAEHADEIVEAAAKELAASLRRSKAFKEMIKGLEEEL